MAFLERFRRKPAGDDQQILAKPLDIPQPAPTGSSDLRRLFQYGQRVARELISDGVPMSQPGANYWVVSYDVTEAIWHPPVEGTWASRTGHTRGGWSQGHCLILFQNGCLADAEWYGEVDPLCHPLAIDNVKNIYIPDHRWSAGNLGRWKRGGGDLDPGATEHFKGFWPRPRNPLPPWAGTSAQLTRFLNDRKSQVPRYYNLA